MNHDKIHFIPSFPFMINIITLKFMEVFLQIQEHAYWVLNWDTSWQNQQNGYAHNEDSDQPGRISAQADQSLCCAFFMRTAKTLIRLGRCPGWSETSLGTHCWFCHEVAHWFIHLCLILTCNNYCLYKEVISMSAVLQRLKWAASWQIQQNGMCAQRRLRPAWASPQSDQSSLSAWTNLRSLNTKWAHSEDSDQTGWMPRLLCLRRVHSHFLVLSWGGSN